MQLKSDSRSVSAYRVVTRTSVVANAEQNGWTVLSSRNDVGSKPKAVIAARPISRWPSSGNGPSPRPPPASAAAAINGTSSLLSRSKTTWTSAVVVPGSKSSSRMSYGSSAGSKHAMYSRFSSSWRSSHGRKAA